MDVRTGRTMSVKSILSLCKSIIRGRKSLRTILLSAIILMFVAGLGQWILQRKVYAAGTITGTVYIDYNANGSRDTSGVAPNPAIDAGIGGITVTAYDSAGVSRGTATSAASGAYSLAATGTGPYRIEFTTLPAGYFPSPAGTNNASTVRFLPDGNSSGIDLGILKPSQYSQSNPLVVTPCYINGNNTGADDVLVALNYDRSGAVQHISLSSQIGSTWGLAWRPRTRTLFAAALLKRQSGLGPGRDGTRGNADDISSIYVIDYNNPGATGTGTVVTAQTINVNSFSGVNVGANPRVGSTPANDLAGNTAPSHDYNVIDKIGRRGIGGIAVSDDGNTLYVVNLNNTQPQLVSLNISNMNSVTLNSAINIPNPGCPGTDSFAPWAVRVKDGEVYVGTVCTADVSQNAQNLRAYVQRLSGSSFTNVDLDSTIAADYMQLYYDRGCKYYNTGGGGRCDRAEWTYWDNNFTFVTIGAQNQVTGVQPILSDIDFDPDGAMIIGLMDRRAHQHGTGNYSPTAADTALYEEISAGTIVKLCNVSGVFVPEGKAGCTRSTTPPYDAGTDPAPGAAGITNTFFNNYSATSATDGHGETFFGGLANLPGAREIVTTMMNPTPVYYSGGWRWLSTATGASTGNFVLYTGNGGTSEVLGKANGLGDTVLMSDPAPLQIGNRVWSDADGDGVQDPNESAIQNVTVQLWADTDGNNVVDTQVGTSTTDSGGNYYFGGVNNTNLLSSCGTTTLTPRVNASSDDAEETGGTVTTTSANLDVAYNGTPAQNIVGLRFNGLTIPRGARITAATVQFTANVTEATNTVNVTIEGEAAGNAATFTTAANNISSRSRTSSSVNWSAIGAWTSGATTNATSPNISSVIQEIVNNPGWASGNSLNLIIEDNGSTSGARRRGRSYDTSTTTAPLLSVTYDCPYRVNANTRYEVRVATGQSALTATPALTTANSDGSANGDIRDSDATLTGANAVISILTGSVGENTHTLDMGFLPTASAIYSIGNRVFYDTNNNGQMDGAEVGIAGVTVQLLDSGNNILQSQVTSSVTNIGYYRFDNLVAGTYRVRVAVSNFTGAGILVGFQNSTNAITGTDQRDNGTDPAANNPSTAGVVTADIVVGNGVIPISEPDIVGAAGSSVAAHATIGDGRDNLTVDFGFYNLCIGNLIFIDANPNGTFGGIDTPLSGATVRLYESNGTTEVPLGPDGRLGTADDITGSTNQVITAANGLYLFCGLIPGSYVVKVNPGTGYRSTTDIANTGNPNSNTDNDDNGLGIAVGQISSAVNLSAVTLTPGSEPTVTQATGTTLNSTLDFGFNAVTAVKFENCVVSAYDDGTLIEWQTGYEVDNLGFTLYRDEEGKRVPVNQQMIAGSALKAGAGTVISSGISYAWWDASVQGKAAAYWLEAFDVDGTSEWFGPFLGNPISGVAPPRSNAVLLERLGQTREPVTRAVEAMAEMPKFIVKFPGGRLAAAESAPTMKLSVKDEGWYRISPADLEAAGFPANLDPQLLQLYVDGKELPIQVINEKEGTAVEFYGMCVNSPYAAMRTYYLIAGTRAGLRVAEMKGNGTATPAASFTRTVERRDKTVYFSSLRNGETENFFGAAISRNPLQQTINLTQVDRAAQTDALLELWLQGVTLVNHEILVQWNGSNLGSISFSGQALGSGKFRLPHSMLTEGQNQVTLTPLGGASDVDLVDAIRVTYQHTYTVDNDALKFTASGGRQVNLDGFSNKAIQVMDITNSQKPYLIPIEIKETQSGGYAVNFAAPGLGERKFLAFTSDRKKTPAALRMEVPSSWKQTANAADFVIITTGAFSQTMESLKARRQGQGWTVAIVDIEDIYDEFSYGQKTPQAVKDFLSFTAKWNKTPRFALFAGDATYDPKNYLQVGDFDFVPTKLIDTNHMETASDDWLVDFNNDGFPEMNVGRLPVRSVEEVSLLVDKIAAYESSTPSREVLLVADTTDIYDFEESIDSLETMIGSRAQVEQIKRGRLDAETARRQLLEALNRGQKLVNYAGHGSVNLWRGNLLTNADARGLTNQKLSVVVILTCLNGYFHDPVLDSLGESLLKAERGGAVAVWSSSSLTEPYPQIVMNEELYKQLFNSSSIGGVPTLGEMIKKAKLTTGDSDIRRTWILFGDPTMKLR
jgi:hypothetical protein